MMLGANLEDSEVRRKHYIRCAEITVLRWLLDLSLEDIEEANEHHPA